MIDVRPRQWQEIGSPGNWATVDNGETARETLSERINVESKRRREVRDFPSLRTVSRRVLPGQYKGRVFVLFLILECII